MKPRNLGKSREKEKVYDRVSKRKDNYQLSNARKDKLDQKFKLINLKLKDYDYDYNGWFREEELNIKKNWMIFHR